MLSEKNWILHLSNMSSFNNPHHIYLFSLKDGKKKLVYGQTPEDALEILALRLSETEMNEVLRDQYIRIIQRDIRLYIDQLG